MNTVCWCIGRQHCSIHSRTLSSWVVKDYLYYNIILLKSVCHNTFAKLHVAILARSSQEISQTVRIDCRSFLSPGRISVPSSKFFIIEKHPKTTAEPSNRGVFIWMNQRATFQKGAVTASRSIDRLRHVGMVTIWTITAVIAATDWAKTVKMQQVKTSTCNERLYFHCMKNLVYELLRSPCVCSV